MHSSTRRASLERLQRASRVRNSKILTEQRSSPGVTTPSCSSPVLSAASSPPKSSLSPTKLNKSAFDAMHEPDEAEGRYLNRHPKSVTFDAAPPQINEYEMATPDLSSIGTNSREGSYESADDDNDVLYDPADVDVQDDSFDESLEDTDKTPVVGPDDWKSDSPFSGRYDARVAGAVPSQARADPDHRPLPPLPGLGHARSRSTDSPASPGLSATAERMLGGGHRSLPVPPPASATKSDIQSFGNGRMTLEERLKLMMLSDDGTGKSAAEQQRERRLRRGAGRERGDTPDTDDVDADNSMLDYILPPRISRESIMRRVNGNEARDEADSGTALGALDPDVAIPTTEMPATEEDCLEDDDDEEGSVIVTRDDEPETEEHETLDELAEHDEVDQAMEHDKDQIVEHEKDEQLVEHERDMLEHEKVDQLVEQEKADDDESHYSDQPSREPSQAREADGVKTPRASSPAQRRLHSNPIPDLSPDALAAGMAQATTDLTEEAAAPSQAPALVERPHTPEKQMALPDYDGSGWGEPDEEFEPGTPDSVIRHPMIDERRESPAIPERIATIRSASGSKLKTRVSNTPSDLATMREARRQFSLEVPQVPPIPERHRNRVSRDMTPAVEEDEMRAEQLERNSSFKNRSLTLDLDMGLSLDQDFERVIEAQKRGYLMRQNTKLVTASDKDADTSWKARSANNSPVKHERPQSWVIEPWDGEERQRAPRKRPGTAGGVPPLPGQGSNAVNAVNAVADDDAHSEAATMDTAERGRLFVKVLGVKDLDLPLPKNERTWFSLTLDNGVHCVTTAWLEIARNAPIGQEFELVVPNDLEFQLTLNVKLDKPAHTSIPVEVTKMARPKTSTFSRVFASPRKRREMEMRFKAEEERFAQQQREALARRKTSPTGYELLSPLAAEDGSFARAYVCLKEHESRCFGRPYTSEVVLFNEWATEEESFASSVKSKRGDTAVVRRAPYQIGKLELQLLFVPRPKNSKDDDMPKSMNSCIRELKAAEERLARSWEGHLSQQGGDCPYWRRRYFKLVGTKLTAYHEATRQPRATINLSNAKRLIDDRRALTERETVSKHGRRRRSAFAEEEEGYMFVEEGFRIRFNNGEVIDFYADTAADKEAWMRVLSEVLGRGEGGGDDDDESQGVRVRAKWCELVFKREEQLRRRSEGRRSHTRTKSSYS